MDDILITDNIIDKTIVVTESDKQPEGFRLLSSAQNDEKEVYVWYVNELVKVDNAFILENINEGSVFTVNVNFGKGELNADLTEREEKEYLISVYYK